MKKAGYGQGGQALPVVTGQDAEMPTVRSIIRGEQSSTVFKDNRELAQVVTTMVDAILSGKKPVINDEKTYNNGQKVVPSFLLKPVINDEKTYNNGQKVVPSFLLKPVIVDLSNWRATLVTSGYYKSDQFR
jgi:putative multiple sugar transport system substrate-binding protein